MNNSLVTNCMDALSLIDTQLPTHQQLLQAKELIPFMYAYEMFLSLSDGSHKVNYAIMISYLRKFTVQISSTPMLVDATGVLPFLANADEAHRVVLSNLRDRLYDVGARSMPQRILQDLFDVELPPSISNMDTRCLVLFNQFEKPMNEKTNYYKTAMEYLVNCCSKYFKISKKLKAKVSLNFSFKFVWKRQLKKYMYVNLVYASENL